MKATKIELEYTRSLFEDARLRSGAKQRRWLRENGFPEDFDQLTANMAKEVARELVKDIYWTETP